MTRITQKKELEQFELHKFEYKKTSEDKAYQTFLNSIYDEDGKLNIIGKDDIIDPDPKKCKITPIPSIIIEVNRVYDKDSNKEYLLYDVLQHGYFEDGTETPHVHLQDNGLWKEYKWAKRPVPLPVYTGTPQRRQFKDYPESSKNRYDIDFNAENIAKIKKQCVPYTRLYVYDLSKSGKGGKDGKIGVENWIDFENRTFKELIEGTYIMKTKMEQQLQALQQREQYLSLREKVLEGREQEQEAATTTTNQQQQQKVKST